MKITYSWIKEFVDVKLSPQKLGDRLTMAGLSVASLDEIDGDWVYDIEVTSNRPDWLSVRGIVREVAAITGAKFKKARPAPGARLAGGKKSRSSGDKNYLPFSVEVSDTKACPLYYGNLITGVKVSASPEWLIKKLNALGLRSVNNVVDITNLCLMEYGQPLHAFDFDKLEGGAIVVRRARDGERLTLIDGTEKKLSAGLLVIADKKKPLAIAGIMGGRDSEVTLNTKNVMLESACFDPVVIRRGTRLLGVASDSSYRFERGVDVPGIKAGLLAATKMICDIGAGTLAASKISGKPAGKPAQSKNKKIIFDLKEAADILSIRVSPKEAKSILQKLGFVVKEKKAGMFEVIAPSFRRDVKGAEDITEEIARAYGYDKIPLTTPEIKPFAMDVPKVQTIERTVRDLLVSMGLKEAITYSLTNEENYTKTALKVPQAISALVNPLSHDYHLLRTTLLPALLECASFNINRNNPDLEIFEIAHVFGNGEETISVGIILAGDKRASWLKESRPYTLYDLKGALESLFDELGVKKFAFSSSDEGALNFCVLLNGSKAGSIGVVSETIKRNWGIKAKGDIFACEFSLSAISKAADLKKVFKPLSSTPSISRDISVLAASTTPYGAITDLIKKKAAGYLKKAALSECYQGKEIPKGFRGLTISLTYGSDVKTLTDAEINLVHSNVLDGLVKELSLTLR